PAYHEIVEDSTRYKALGFEEGHYLQVEVAAVTTKGAQNDLARRFLDFMTGPGFQDAIPETNWMFPAGEMSAPLNPAFERAVKPAHTLAFTPQEVAENRQEWVRE